MANMIKFYRGLVETLPATGENGALYITTDEGAIYYGTGTGMKRLGDFVQVDAVANLPAKAHEGCLYYCVAENILAKWNGTEWKQINKQPTSEELKGLLGLAELAYKSEVAEGDLNADLAAKINAASGVQHSHDNKTVLDGITAEKVTAWDNAEQNAKNYADGKDSAMNTRVEALETAIGENGSVATQIKTAVEALDYTDTAVDGEYVSAVNEVDGKISVTRKALPDYTNTYDAKGAAATALDNAKAYADGLAANYDEKGAAAGVKTELEAEIAKKVDKVEGKSLIADTEIARLATLANYDDTQVKADIAKKADAEAVTTELGKKVDKIEGYSLVSDAEIARLADVDNYDDTALAGRVSTAEGKISALEGASATHATKEELNAVDAKFDDYKTAEAQKAIDDEQDRRLGVIEGDYLKAADIANFETKENVKKVADDLAAYVESNDAAVADRYTKEEADGKFALIADAYDDEEVRGLISDNADAIAAEKERAEAAEAGLQTQINTIMNNPDAEGAINSINEFTKYVEEHGDIADGFRTDINKNKEDIAAVNKALGDHEALAAETYETKTDAAQKLTDAKAYTDAEVAKDRVRLDTLEAIDHDAYVAADAVLKGELQAEIDADVDALANGQVKTNTEAIAANAAAITSGDEATLASAKSYCDGLLEWGSF